ncbi:tape measure domain protein [compost metagenome]
MAGKVTTQFVIEGKNNSRKAFKEAGKDVEELGARVSRLADGVKAAFAGGLVAEGIRQFSGAADAVKLMDAQLKLATGSQQEFNRAQEELFNLAQKTQAPLQSLVTLYTRIARPLREAGRSQEEILQVTEAVATAFRVSGVSASEADPAIVQFAQALGAGALRGDEFNSVAEQAPRLMQALADSLGVPVGALKELAGEGKLAADVVADALIQQLPKLRKEAKQIPDTVGGSLTALGNSVTRFAGQADSSIGFTQGLINRIKLLGSAADAVTDVFKAFSKDGLAGAEKATEGLLDGAKIASFEVLLQRMKQARDELANDGSLGIANRLLFGNKDAAYFDRQIDQVTQYLERLRKAAEKETSEADKIAAIRLAREANYRKALKGIRDQVVADAEAAIKQQQAAEKKALAELEKFAKERKAIQQRYKDAIAGFNAGADSQASFGAANALKVGARDALRAGDAETAQQQAQVALKMLQDLAAAGQSTYGFAGFAKELQAIELAATDLEQSNAEQKLAAIRENLEQLQTQADALKNVNITINLSEEEIAKVKGQMESLAAELGQTLIIPARIQPTSEMNAMALQGGDQVTFPTSGYAQGTHSAAPGIRWAGEYGPELVGFNGGEKVLTALASRSVASRLEGLSVPDGGAQVLAEVAQSAQVNPFDNDWGRFRIEEGGRSIEVLARKASAEELLRRAARKGGRNGP